MTHEQSDPVIDKIREIQQRISARFDHDPARLIAFYWNGKSGIEIDKNQECPPDPSIVYLSLPDNQAQRTRPSRIETIDEMRGRGPLRGLVRPVRLRGRPHRSLRQKSPAVDISPDGA